MRNFIATALLLCSGLASTPASQQFGPAQLLAAPVESPYSVYAADLDGDGDLDVLSASIEDDKIAWYEKVDGEAVYGAQRVISELADGARSVHAADLDGDGDADVLSASRYDDKVAWYENLDGLGSFGPQQVITTAAPEPLKVFAADLDGDGDQDVLSTSVGDKTAGWYENRDGQGTFGVRQVITARLYAPAAVMTTDVDGDGDPDLLATWFDAGFDKVVWFENRDGQGTFGGPQLVANAVWSPTGVDAADLDGDGDPDVLATSYDYEIVSWFENRDGQGSFGLDQKVTYDVDASSLVWAADLDGDGDQDAVTVSTLYNEIVWNQNLDGLGTFGNTKGIVGYGPLPDHAVHDLLPADLDGDGDRDLLATSGPLDSIYWIANTDGLGTFGAVLHITPPTMVFHSVFAADLDGDGDRDALSASNAGKNVAWYENLDGQGGLWTQRLVTTKAEGGRSVFAADLDGDGDRDVLSASQGNGATPDDRVAWYENLDGQGSFGPQQLITTQSLAPVSVFAADLDGDGDRDALSASMLDGAIAWYANRDGLGNFGPRQVIAVAPGASEVSAADLDGDGDTDVLAASADDDTVAWYENSDGLGGFGTPQPITAAADGASSVFAADLDADGDLDVVSAASLSGSVAWHENTDGKGSFGPPQVLTTAAVGVQSVRAADLDGDGDLDVGSASTQAESIAWYENLDGLGGFGPRQVISTGLPGARSICAADLDGDGYGDLLLAASMGTFFEQLAWYENLQEALTADASAVSLAAGGAQQFDLTAGTTNRNRPYLLLGTLSGTSPGLAVDGLVLPLNPDPYFLYTAGNPNSSNLVNTLGTLARDGTGSAKLDLPPGLNPALAGAVLHHGYLVFDVTTAPGGPFVGFVSNPVPLTLLP